MNNYTHHQSVLLQECLEFLKGSEGKSSLYADLTFGGGGHSKAIIDNIANSQIVACDQDPDALTNGKKIISENGLENRIKLFDTNFVGFPEIAKEELKSRGVEGFQGILMDLGVSSHHFDSSERGFSFRHPGPLDMRMDTKRESLTAADILNEYSFEEIQKILQEYGEERFSHRIAEKVVEFRKVKPFEKTSELENIVFHCYPKNRRHGKPHPSTRTFQALRIAVNRELEVLTDVISKLPPFLCPGGRVLVISFHSLEDRIVKHEFKRMGSRNSEGPYMTLTKKPITPSELEQKDNARSRSAKLRVLERIVENSGK